ncbi:MAG: Threonine synthase [Pseudomonadota bacterium]|jgi:threonine synthase
MLFASTRGKAPQIGFSEALQQGLAPDGGLYVPTAWPDFDATGIGDVADLPAVAEAFIGGFAAGDVLAPQMHDIVAEAFNFPAPLLPLDPEGRLHVLELFHGPTAAFKDFGARFLAACLVRLRRGKDKPLRILVATSGDTGGAVAAAFHRQPGIEVVVLFPKGLVSPTQQQQLTCWGDNVRSLAVQGTFDDCQRLVKEAFMDDALRSGAEMSSANSINLGRLLPQAVYYAATSLCVWRNHGQKASYIIPSGNLGNSVACLWARQMGLPIGDIILAHNANRTVVDYLESGDLRPRPSLSTLASAMDVGNPSNLERMSALFPDASRLGKALSAVSIGDEQIRLRIAEDFRTRDEIWCPHTATAAEVYQQLSSSRRDSQRWVLVATAHPAKFREIVEPLIGTTVPVPANLQRLFGLPSHYTEIPAQLSALREVLSA